MNDRGTYDGVPTRLKVADVLVNYGKDVSFTRSGLIKSPFRDERTPSFHILAGGYGWVDFGDGTKGGVIDLVHDDGKCPVCPVGFLPEADLDATEVIDFSFHLENTFEIVVPSGTSGFAWQDIRAFLTERTVRERRRSCRGRTRIGLASGKVFQVRGTP